MLSFFLLCFIFLVLLFYSWYRLYTKLHFHGLGDSTLITKYRLPYQHHYFTTKDGIKISSWYIPVKHAKGVVILIHGFKRTENGKVFGLGYAQFLYAAGYSTLLVDLRSVGDSPGNKVWLGVKEWQDVAAAYDFVKFLPENKGKKIGYLGISMGAATVLIAAGKTGKGDFVIASVPYASFTRMFVHQLKQAKLPPSIFSVFLRLAALFELGWNYDSFSPVNFIKKIHVPVLFFAAEDDDMVNTHDAKLLFDAANEPKEYFRIDTKHDIFQHEPEVFQKHVLKFLEKYGET